MAMMKLNWWKREEKISAFRSTFKNMTGFAPKDQDVWRATVDLYI